MVRKLSEAMSQTNVDPLTIQACLAEFTQMDTEMKRLAQRVGAMFRRYEGQGVIPRSIKRAHRLAKLDKAAAAAETRTDIRYLVVAGVLKPADDAWVQQVSQSDLFATDEDAETIGTPSPDLARARAHTDGYNSGRHGGELNANPFPAGSAEHVAWHQGCADGQADRSLRGDKGKAADANPRKRGRPLGSRNKANGEAAHA